MDHVETIVSGDSSFLFVVVLEKFEALHFMVGIYAVEPGEGGGGSSEHKIVVFYFLAGGGLDGMFSWFEGIPYAS